MAADEDDQTDELLVLASIYDDSSFTSQRDSEGLLTGTLKASVEVRQRPFYVMVADNGENLRCNDVTFYFIAARFKVCEL